MVIQIGFRRERCTKRLIDRSRRNVRAGILQGRLTRLGLDHALVRIQDLPGPLVHLTHLDRLGLDLRQGNKNSAKKSLEFRYFHSLSFGIVCTFMTGFLLGIHFPAI